jgi:hypothetical protein
MVAFGPGVNVLQDPALLRNTPHELLLIFSGLCHTCAADVEDLCHRLQDMTAMARSAPLLTLEWASSEENVALDEEAKAESGEAANGVVAAGRGGVRQPDEGAQGCEESQLDRQASSGDEWQLV